MSRERELMEQGRAMERGYLAEIEQLNITISALAERVETLEKQDESFWRKIASVRLRTVPLR